jgi:hypothetical protein
VAPAPASAPLPALTPAVAAAPILALALAAAAAPALLSPALAPASASAVAPGLAVAPAPAPAPAPLQPPAPAPAPAYTLSTLSTVVLPALVSAPNAATLVPDPASTAAVASTHNASVSVIAAAPASFDRPALDFLRSQGTHGFSSYRFIGVVSIFSYFRLVMK